MSNKLLMIRVDANRKIGTGHFMRCLALAQAWIDEGGKAEFITNNLLPVLKVRLQDDGINIKDIDVSSGSLNDAEIVSTLAKRENVTWLVTDGYNFDSSYQKFLKKENFKLLCIDDIGNGKHYYADIILNQNLHADENLYTNRESYTRLLLGTKYVLLRREFLHYKNKKRTIAKAARKILITLGGIDFRNGTLKIIQSMQKATLDGLEFKVVVGAGNTSYKLLLSAVQNSQYPVYLEYNTPSIAKLMHWADLAISSGGTTVWELAFMGVPTLVTATTAIEKELVKGLIKHGLFYNLGSLDELNPRKIPSIVEELTADYKTRLNISRLGRKLVDGLGSQRVISKLKLKE